jgi:hexosaminidase
MRRFPTLLAAAVAWLPAACGAMVILASPSALAAEAKGPADSEESADPQGPPGSKKSAGLEKLAGSEASQAALFAPLVPAPRLLKPGRSAFALRETTPVVATSGPESERIARYFVDLTSRTTSLKLQVNAAPASSHGISLSLDASAPSGEGYSLDVSTERIRVRAAEPRGLFYGAVSLWQLVFANAPTIASGKNAAARIPALKIEDSPRFAWRGLMLDVARHYLPSAGVKQLLDQMALHKLNTFHWHLTDDQGWRIQINKYPKLTQAGAWRVPAGADPACDIDPTTGKPRLYGGYYTQNEIREIVRYAADRFITIVPEIEMPGHAQAAIAAYPRLGTEGATPTVSSDWGVHTYLYNVDESTFTFLEDVLTEVMALFPGQYIHTGGDEAVKDRWRVSPRVQQRMRELGVANEAALQGYFTRRMEAFLSSHGRKLIGWDEILEGGLPPAATVMSWRGEAGAIEAAKAGHDVVLAPSPDLYLDYLQGDAADEPAGRPRYVTLEDMYRFNAVPAAVTGEAARHVLGAQINAWTEHMRTPERMQHAIFPRMAAFAENLWSQDGARDWHSFKLRLPAQIARYRSLGIQYADSGYAVRLSGAGPFQLLNQLGTAGIHYTLDGSEPTIRSPLYVSPLKLTPPLIVKAATFQQQIRVSAPRTYRIDRPALLRRNSDELKSCSNKLPLRLEDDAPRDGPRAVFNVDILDPCWIYPRADLSQVRAIAASVGQVPFNFQVGDDVKKIPLYAPQTAQGELEVRLDSCEGERIAALPLAGVKQGEQAVSALPAVTISPRAGAHDLCLRFTRRSVDPIWAIDSVQLVE